MIERVIRCALQAGADDFYVVIGYQGERVRAFLEDLAGRIQVPITSIANGVWEGENGLSVLKAREYLRGPFLLLMADHRLDRTSTALTLAFSCALPLFFDALERSQEEHGDGSLS